MSEASLFKESLKYCRLLPRKTERQSICEEGKVPKEILEDLFGVKITSRQLEERLRRIFLEDCEHLLDKYFDKRYKYRLKNNIKDVLRFLYTKSYDGVVDKVVTLNDYPKTEHLINLICFLLQHGMSWSEWLLCMPSGQKLLFSVFEEGVSITNVRQIIKMLSTISVLQQYDTIYFREEFKLVFNDMILMFSQKLKTQGMEKLGVDISEYWTLWVANQITTEALSYILITAVTLISKKLN